MYVSSSDVHEYAGFPDSDTLDDALITRLIARSTSIVELYTDRCFEAASDVRYFNVEDDTEDDVLYLDKDLVGFATDTLTIASGSDSTYVSDCIPLTRNDAPYFAVQIKSASGKTWDYATDGSAQDAISVDGLWGYSTSCPTDVQHATIRLCKWLYDQRVISGQDDRPVVLEAGVTILPSRLPADVTDILDHYLRTGMVA